MPQASSSMAKSKDKKNSKKIEAKSATKAKKPVKKAEKATAVVAKIKGAASKIVKAVQKAAHPEKAVKASEKAAIKPAQKSAAKPTLAAKSAKKEESEKKSVALDSQAKMSASKKTDKTKKTKKKEEGELTDDLVGDVEDFGADELKEYESELETAEALEAEEAPEWTEESAVAAAAKEDDEVILTDAEGRRYCRLRDCDQAAMVDSYCRYHYLLLWKKIQVRKKILTEGKLDRYIEELTSRYPDKFLEVIRRDLRTEKDFLSAIQELEIDESSTDTDFEEENTNYLDEVRGATSEGTITEEEEF